MNAIATCGRPGGRPRRGIAYAWYQVSEFMAPRCTIDFCAHGRTESNVPVQAAAEEAWSCSQRPTGCVCPCEPATRSGNVALRILGSRVTEEGLMALTVSVSLDSRVCDTRYTLITELSCMYDRTGSHVMKEIFFAFWPHFSFWPAQPKRAECPPPPTP